jgi:hypothetical protein
VTAKQFGGARLPKERSFLPKGFVSRRYFVYEAEARAEPRRWMCHHQIIPLVQGFYCFNTRSRPGPASGSARELAWRTTKRRHPLCLRLNVPFFREPRPTTPNALLELHSHRPQDLQRHLWINLIRAVVCTNHRPVLLVGKIQHINP